MMTELEPVKMNRLWQPVVEAIADACGVDVDDILVPGRSQRSVETARLVIVYTLSRHSPSKPTSVELGRAFRRDHTTILSAIRTIERRRSEPWVKRLVEVGRLAIAQSSGDEFEQKCAELELARERVAELEVELAQLAVERSRATLAPAPAKVVDSPFLDRAGGTR